MSESQRFLGSLFGDPRIDGGGWVRGPFGWVWVPPGPFPWQLMAGHPTVLFLDALHDSLDDKSDEAFQKALSEPENISVLSRLHRKTNKKKSEKALLDELDRLREELRGDRPNKPTIWRRIQQILEQLGEQ